MGNIFKTIAILIFVFGVATVDAQVKDTVPYRDTITPSPIPGKVMTTDASEYVYMKKGILMLHQAKEKDAVVLSTYNCDDGSTVTTDGTYTPRDGAILRLSDGDKVYKDGRYDLNRK
jgi:hypothetical protein